MNALIEVQNCWREIGVWGARSCPQLKTHTHCHNCPVYASAGRNLLERQPPKEYIEEWTEFLKRKDEQSDSKSIDALSIGIFRLGNEWLSLPSHLFAEVTDLLPIHTIPHRTNPILLGMVNIRGEIQLCVSLHNLLGINKNSQEITTKNSLIHQRMIVVAKDRDRWVFITDEMDGIYRLQSQLFNAPATVAKRSESYNHKVFIWNDRQVGLLDPDLLFYSLSRRVL